MIPIIKKFIVATFSLMVLLFVYSAVSENHNVDPVNPQKRAEDAEKIRLAKLKWARMQAKNHDESRRMIYPVAFYRGEK